MAGDNLEREVRRVDDQRRIQEGLRRDVHIVAYDGVCFWVHELFLEGQLEMRLASLLYADFYLGHTEWRTISLRPHILHRTISGTGPARRCRAYPSASVQNTRLARSPDTSQWCHPTRQEHHFPQAHRLVYRVLLMGPHYRALEQLCATGSQTKARLRWFPPRQLGHWSRLVRLYHADRTHGHGLHIAREASSCQLRALLVHASHVHRVLHFLVRPWGVLHDQE